MLSRSKPTIKPQYKHRIPLFLVHAQSKAMSHTLQTTVHTPLCDRRSYHYAQLQNGLRALVVQDKDAIYAAACASVQVGYFDDPSALPGAAHFLEHMVHLGSTTYPDEKEYKNYLAQHGGSSNASTSEHPQQQQDAGKHRSVCCNVKAHSEFVKAMTHTLTKHSQLIRVTTTAMHLRAGEAQDLNDLPLSPPCRTSMMLSASHTSMNIAYCSSACDDHFSVCITGMVHTKYHFKVHNTALQGALQRFGAMLSCPLIAHDSAAREVENVHAEYSRNTNSDGRKLLQLRRSLCKAPYCNFSTGSMTTLWEQPGQQQLDVPAVLRGLWETCYKADATCVAVVGPQKPEVLLQWVEDAFESMPTKGTTGSGVDGKCVDGISVDSSISTAVCSNLEAKAVTDDSVADVPTLAVPRYPVDVVAAGSRGVLVRVCPQRELRELELSWYIPQGMMVHSSTKPWSWASHVLGHEGSGSVAHLLKAQGLVQSLEVGTGEEVRLGRGWMFWRVCVSLSRAGEDALPHVVATIYRGIQLLQRCSDAELASTWHEAARVAELRFNWQDPTEPLTCAQSAAYALHYYPPHATLSGSHLMTEFNASVLRWFAQQLSINNMVVYYSSHKNRSLVDSKEPWYGAEYAVQPLPQDWLHSMTRHLAVAAPAPGGSVPAADSIEASKQRAGSVGNNSEASGTLSAEGVVHDYQHKQQWQVASVLGPHPGELHLPEPNWALPKDLTLRGDDASISTNGSTPPSPEVYDGAPSPPEVLHESAGLCVWHKRDISYGLPKVQLHLHLVTPISYCTPQGSVTTRLLLRVLEDVLLPFTYPAELAGSWYDISSEQGGLALKVVGFPGLAQKLLLVVLQGLMGLTAQQVQKRFGTVSGRLLQNLTNWAKNNPQQHAEYAAHHLLQHHHHHNTQLLQAVGAVVPEQLLFQQQQLASGSELHIDMLAYGNISRQEVMEFVGQLQQQVKPQGLPAGLWPPAGRVLSLNPVTVAGAAGDACSEDGEDTQPSRVTTTTAAAAGELHGQQLTAAAVDACSNVLVTYLPDNPNPSNSNSAIYYTLQLGPDAVEVSVLLDLFVQMSSKAAFHELRTRQRLGYSVNLSSCSLHRQLGLMIRVQSPSSSPEVCVSAVRGWLSGFRAELQEMAQHQLGNVKKALRDKYLDPPKSLHEAARRTWIPIKSRSLCFGKRQQKAAQVEQLALQQLMDFYDTYVDPEGPYHRALCVEIWGGRQRAPVPISRNTGGSSSSAVSAGSNHIRRITVSAEGVDAFKLGQPLLPLADITFPPPAIIGQLP